MFHPIISSFSNLSKNAGGRDFYPPILTMGHPTAIVPPDAIVPVIRLFPAGDASAHAHAPK